MVGDAPGDLAAAQENHGSIIQFWQEKKSILGKKFRDEAIKRFVEGSFSGDYQNELIQAFNNNLK